jgi:hypothetical protein
LFSTALPRLPSIQAAEFKNNSALPKPKGPVAIAEGGSEISNADGKQMLYADTGFGYGDHRAGVQVITTFFEHAYQKIRATEADMLSLDKWKKIG